MAVGAGQTLFALRMHGVAHAVGRALRTLSNCCKSSKHCRHFDYHLSHLYRLSSEELLLLFDLILGEYLHNHVGVALV